MLRRHRRTLADVLADNLRRPDPRPAPPVDLLMILMGQPNEPADVAWDDRP